MIRIKSILFNRDSEEADVELESNGVCIRCYLHPIESIERIPALLENNLLAFLVTDVVEEDDPVPIASQTNDGYYSYYLRGRVISESQIQIHEFIIDIGFLPNDIHLGAIVSCQCLRIDMLNN